jgi:hypothetical protein
MYALSDFYIKLYAISRKKREMEIMNGKGF